jgi:hypothetical protein
VPAAEELNARWSRKHDLPGSGFAAPRIVYPAGLRELIEVCRDLHADERLHAAGSHWGLNQAAMSDHTFIETHDPRNVHPAMNRMLHEVVPGCLTHGFLEHMAHQVPNQFGDAYVETRWPYYVHVETGMRVYEAYAALDRDAGDDPQSLASTLRDHWGNDHFLGPWAFRTLGSAGGQTVFGALTTGTHGGDFKGGPIADDVVALHLVGSGGQHYWIEPGYGPERVDFTDDDKLKALYGPLGNFEIIRDDDVFQAVLVAAGRFGVVYSVVLRVVRQYMLNETRQLGYWQNVRDHIGNRSSALYGVPHDNKFLQVVVCLTPHDNFQKNLVGVTKRVTRPWDPATGEPNGRDWRVGPNGRNAGHSVSLPPDPSDTSKPGAGGFLERACANGDFVLGILEATVDEIEQFVATHTAASGGAIAAVAAFGGAGIFALPLLAVVKALAALVAALAASGSDQRLAQAVDQARAICLGHGNAGLFVWQVIAYRLFVSQQGPIDYTAISYAVMDTHDYLDQSCNVNVDSVEVFFEAEDPMLIAYVDALIAFETRQEFLGRACLGYASVRFTSQGRALLAPERWPHTAVVEVAALRDLEGSDQLLDYAVALARNPNFNAAFHWGQRHESQRPEIERRFGADLDTWRLALGRIAGNDETFSSEFTRRTGLEPS